MARSWLPNASELLPGLCEGKAVAVGYAHQPPQLFTLFFVSSPSEKKKEKEREELWKKLEDLELKRGLSRDGIIPT